MDVRSVGLGMFLLAMIFFFPSSILSAQERGKAEGTDFKVTADYFVERLRPRHSGARSLNNPRLISCDENLDRKDRGVKMEPVSEEVDLTVEFASDSHELTPEARRRLDVLGEALGSAGLKPYCFWIEGHTDDQNTNSYNMELSDRRAARVVSYLVDRHGIAEERLIADGKGEEEPKVSNATEEGRRLNRRVQVSNLGVFTAAGRP